MPVVTLQLNAVHVLALAALGLAAGVWIKNKIPLLDRLNIPASIIGGLIYALLALALRDRVLNLDMDLVLRDLLMVAFFTSVGMSASLALAKKGGVQVLFFLGLATAGAVLQNILGIGLAIALGLNPLIGIVAGSISMTGGPATALAFGPTLEQLGAGGASTLGVAAAMFGILAGGLLGGHIGGSLIRKNHLHATPSSNPSFEEVAYGADAPDVAPNPATPEAEEESSPLMTSVIVIAVAMGIGSLISAALNNAGVILPSYVGAMIAAGFIRNLDDRLQFARISQHQIDSIGNVALSLFIVMALMTLRLWELANLALPLLGILLVQLVLVCLLSLTLVYYTMGKDYEAAVISGGYCGFMTGTTANAMACMQVLVEKYGPAPRAYIVVPLVGAFFIDFTNALVISAMANLFK